VEQFLNYKKKQSSTLADVGGQLKYKQEVIKRAEIAAAESKHSTSFKTL
jgi:hypothetical protein